MKPPDDEARDLLTFNVASVLFERTMLADRDCMQMATAIIQFLEHEGLSQPFPSDLVTLSTARCLAGVDRGAGLELLNEQIDDQARLPLYHELLLTRPFSYRQWRLVAAGVLSREQGSAVSTKPTYTLHVSRVSMEKDDLELTIFGTIKHLLQVFSGLWDSRSGQFHLGIKGLPRMKGRDKNLPSSKDVVEFCRDWFDLIAKDRAWVEAPDITVRDLGTI